MKKKSANDIGKKNQQATWAKNQQETWVNKSVSNMGKKNQQSTWVKISASDIGKNKSASDMGKNKSASDSLKCVFSFSRKQTLTFHEIAPTVYVKSRDLFSEKNKKISICRLSRG